MRGLCVRSYELDVIEGWLRRHSPAGYAWGISNGATFLAEAGNAIVGFCETIPGEILAVFVDPAYMRKADDRPADLRPWRQVVGHGWPPRLRPLPGPAGRTGL